MCSGPKLSMDTVRCCGNRSTSSIDTFGVISPVSPKLWHTAESTLFFAVTVSTSVAHVRNLSTRRYSFTQTNMLTHNDERSINANRFPYPVFRILFLCAPSHETHTFPSPNHVRVCLSVSLGLINRINPVVLPYRVNNQPKTRDTTVAFNRKDYYDLILSACSLRYPIPDNLHVLRSVAPSHHVPPSVTPRPDSFGPRELVQD